MLFRSLRIVGLLSPRGSDGVDDEDDVMVAPLTTTVDEIVGTVESFSHLVVQAVSPEALSAAVDEITAVLRQAHQLEPGAPPDFNLINAASWPGRANRKPPRLNCSSPRSPPSR